MFAKGFLCLCICLHLAIVCNADGWSQCGTEVDHLCKTSYPYTLVRYGEDGKYSYAELTGIGARIECDNRRFGDPSKTKKKQCWETDYKMDNPGVWKEPLVAADSMWVKCADEGGKCNPKTLGAPGHLCVMKARYGAEGRYGYRDFEVSTNSHSGIGCNDDVFGDPVSKHKSCYYYKGGCRPDTSISAVNFTTELRGCGQEGYTCMTGVGDMFDTVMIRFGMLDLVNGNDNTALWRTVSTPQMACTKENFGDPAKTLKKQCRTFWPEQIVSVEGRWASVASGKEISMTLQRGVSRREGKETTQEFSESLTVAIEQKFKYFTIGSTRATVSSTTSYSVASTVSEDTTMEVSQSYSTSCPALSNGATQYMYQWQMAYDEVADWGEIPGSSNLLLYTAFTLCSPYGPTVMPPQCPLTECVDTDPGCTKCISGPKLKTEL